MCYELRHKRIYYRTYSSIFYKLANHEVLNIQDLTFHKNGSGQVHSGSSGGRPFKLKVTPGEQTTLQSPKQGQQHHPAGSTAAIHHHDLTLRGDRRNVEGIVHLNSEAAHTLKTPHLFGCHVQQRLHDGQNGADVKVCRGSLRWEQ